jgi:hypothetical protein
MTKYRSDQAKRALAAAVEAGLKVGTDGSDLLILSPLRMPRDQYFAHQRELVEHRSEIIGLIERERARDAH